MLKGNGVTLEGDENALKNDGEVLRGDGAVFNCSENALKGEADA